MSTEHVALVDTERVFYARTNPSDARQRPIWVINL